ncbi:unnamed protein product, partial [Prorocentrum cordatum]
VEGVLLDRGGSPVGTAWFAVRGSWPPDVVGMFVECQFLATSVPLHEPMLQGLFGMGQAVLHLCGGRPAVICRQEMWPGRQVLQGDTFRVVPPSAFGAGLPGAVTGAAAPKAAAGVGALAALPGGAGAAAGGTAGPNDGDGADSSGDLDPKKLKDKQEKLHHRLAQKRNIGSLLASRAEQHLDGRCIQSVSRSAPGALLASGLEQIKQLLAQRGGADTEENLNSMAAMVVQYITSAWHGRHPPRTMGVRKNNEMIMVGECLDALLAGRRPELGDMLMQRLKAIEQAHMDGHWAVAQHLEVGADVNASLARASEVRDAVSAFEGEARLAQHLAAAGKKTGKPSDGVPSPRASPTAMAKGLQSSQAAKWRRRRAGTAAKRLAARRQEHEASAWSVAAQVAKQLGGQPPRAGDEKGDGPSARRPALASPGAGAGRAAPGARSFLDRVKQGKGKNKGKVEAAGFPGEASEDADESWESAVTEAGEEGSRRGIMRQRA